MKTDTNQEKIKEVLTKGVAKIYPSEKELEKAMNSGKKLRLYCGYDPSDQNLHIGHTITLRKLAQFQKLGHEVIMLIGDFTGMIGDPTDKKAARKKLTRQTVTRNSRNYKRQAGKILNFGGPNPAKLLRNSRWSDKLSFLDLIETAANFTVQQMIVRDMFQERIKNKKPIYLHEFLYPLAQAYDSVAMNVGLEVGGSDQIFNMLAGRDLMRIMKNKEKFVLATKLLTDPAGKKMGKTEGNIVAISSPAKEIYGKIMSWPDTMITLGFELCTDLPMEEINQISEKIKKGKINPRDAKARLAREIVAVCHDKKSAAKAAADFNRVFREKKTPGRMPEIKIQGKEIPLASLLLKAGLASSKSEVKRLVLQNGVKINGQTQKNWQEIVKIKKGLVLQVGKRRFAKLG